MPPAPNPSISILHAPTLPITPLSVIRLATIPHLAPASVMRLTPPLPNPTSVSYSTPPPSSSVSDGTHLTSNQINRIALHKAKAIEIKRAKRQAAHAALPRVDISATPEELAPVSMHMHGGATSHFRRRFRFGGVSAAVAVAHTNAKP